ncbi:FtsK/SpoIIIE domain-containing protein [Prescottella subtropica]|uniref:FtsK/SpoIIIE domain-containing protein n=1 Tax=Prescottella subtropica TaxID=2545757 RepID=UPI0010FA3336|nr:FtsK/SpoIIIE domain-containing protein [Prescottella subtropica]
MTTAAALPDLIHFPEPGTPAFVEAIDLARRGIFRFGLAEDGSWVDWNLSEAAHGLVAGRCGSGKSVALSIVLFYAAYLPDLYEVNVCDARGTDFRWAQGFPNVQMATSDAEIVAAIKETRRAIDERQSFRDRCAADPEAEREHGPTPKRLIFFFDNIVDFFAPTASEDDDKVKDRARADMEAIARLGRLLDVHVIAATQRLETKLFPAELRSQLKFRLSVGAVDEFTSQLVLGSDHGTRFPDDVSSKGRAWVYDPVDGHRLVQLMFLDPESTPSPWQPDSSPRWAHQHLCDHLAALGYGVAEAVDGEARTVQQWSRP